MYSRSIQEQQRWSRFNRNRNVVSIHMLRFIHSPPLSRRGGVTQLLECGPPVAIHIQLFAPNCQLSQSQILSSTQLSYSPKAEPLKTLTMLQWSKLNKLKPTWKWSFVTSFYQICSSFYFSVKLTSRPRVSVTTDLVVVRTNPVRHLLLRTTWKLHWKMHGSHICFVQFWKICGDQI